MRRELKHISNIDLYRQKEKQYNALTRKKKRQYILEKEKSDLLTFTKNPKKGWRQVKSPKKKIMGNISDEDMLEYVIRLYNHANATGMGTEEIPSASTNPLAFEDIETGLKKMANAKASDHMSMCAEFLKWTGNEAREWLSHVLTHALHHGFPPDWQENWVQPLFKGGDRNSVQSPITKL